MDSEDIHAYRCTPMDVLTYLKYFSCEAKPYIFLVFVWAVLGKHMFFRVSEGFLFGTPPPIRRKWCQQPRHRPPHFTRGEGQDEGS